MSTLDAYLKARPDRCDECGYAAVQGCRCSGQARKERALSLVNNGAPADVKAAIDTAILRLARLGVPFSVNDCRDDFPDVNGSVIGGRFNALGKAGLIVKTGNRVPSTLPNTHGHELHEWTGAAA